MTPAAALAMLGRQIDRHGQTVTLSRVVANGEPVEFETRAFVRGYRAEELTGEVTVGTTAVILLPTSLRDSAFGNDIRRETDSVWIDGALRKILVANAVRLDDVLVRWNLTVE